MFDLTSSKLLILGIVALIVVGPKDLPMLLRTIGKYVGMIRRHANDFRAQFDEAMRDQELANLKSEMDAVKRDVESTVNTTGRSVESDLSSATRDIEHHINAPVPPGGTPPSVSPAAEPAHHSIAPASNAGITAPKAGA